ncbi:hypothetical protein D3C80_2147570 [compost metagenome]
MPIRSLTMLRKRLQMDDSAIQGVSLERRARYTGRAISGEWIRAADTVPRLISWNTDA